MEATQKTSIARQVATAAILLAICIASQFLKNLSVYITGPIVNLCLILAVMMIGLPWGIILAVITPVTAFFIASSPVIAAIPWLMLPLIMLGNAVLVVMVHFLFKPAVADPKPLLSVRSILMAVLSCAAKACVMWLTISLWVLPTFIPQAAPKIVDKIPVFQSMFSLVQLITALIAFVYFFILSPVLKRIEL